MQRSIALICPPFAPIYTPSLALSTLKSVGASCGVNVTVIYSSLKFAEIIGADLYDEISAGHPSVTDLAGEWVFAHLIGGHLDEDAYIERILLARDTVRRVMQKSDGSRLREFGDKLRIARRCAGAFVETEAKRILSNGPDVVGFTSVFQQTACGLALAATIKRLNPNIRTIFGGPNYEGLMGQVLQKNFPQIEEVVSGEGEQAFRAFASDLAGMPVAFPIRVSNSAAKGRGELDDLPVPDFDDFFQSLAETTLSPRPHPHLVMETSRGCWWGERSHCTFCGLNGSNMRFRGKSAGRALRELMHLVDRYGPHPIDTVDNILDFDYFKSFLPDLQQRDLKLNIFYETKSNLSRAKLAQLAASGVLRIQPGIESLSDEVLRLMGKGVTAAQNLATIKWCQELGIHLSWNFLWGFPGESADEYERLAQLCPLLEHLVPPDVGSQLRLDRFSPLFEQRECMGLRDVQPYPAYQYVFSGMSETDLFDVAYYFTFQYKCGRDVAGYTEHLSNSIERWRGAHKRSILLQMPAGNGVTLVFDTRACRTRPMFLLDGIHNRLLNACSTPCTEPDLLAQSDAAEGDSRSALQDLVEHRLVLPIGRVFFALPHAFELERMPSDDAAIFSELLHELGMECDSETKIPAASVTRLSSRLDARV